MVHIVYLHITRAVLGGSSVAVSFVVVFLPVHLQHITGWVDISVEQKQNLSAGRILLIFKTEKQDKRIVILINVRK